MPIIFAYGSNLDRAGMLRRCPGAVPMGPGRCVGYDFFIMAQGYGSIRPDPAAMVHGLLWSVPGCDLPALDAYEEVEAGLYGKVVLTIDRPDGTQVDALVYVGASDGCGNPQPGYMELVIAAAAANDLPAAYCEALRRWLPAAAARGRRSLSSSGDGCPRR